MVITQDVFEAATGVVDVITIGLDLNAGKTPRYPHAELVFLFKVPSGERIGVTGKSYPLASQEHTLVHASDLASHFMEAAGERVLVLGCHDLNLFSPRAYANQRPEGARRERTDAFQLLAKKFGPTVVLQHPHTTDTPRIWSAAWGPITRAFDGLKGWASGITYWNHGVTRIHA